MYLLPILPPRLEPVVRVSKNGLVDSSVGRLCEEIVCQGGALVSLLAADESAPKRLIVYRRGLMRRTISALLSGKVHKRPVESNRGGICGSFSSMVRKGRKEFHRALLNGQISCSKHSIVIMNPSLSLRQYKLPHRVTVRLFRAFMVHNLVERRFTSGVKITGDGVQRGRPIM